jgi:hypothetical protein
MYSTKILLHGLKYFNLTITVRIKVILKRVRETHLAVENKYYTFVSMWSKGGGGWDRACSLAYPVCDFYASSFIVICGLYGSTIV